MYTIKCSIEQAHGEPAKVEKVKLTSEQFTKVLNDERLLCFHGLGKNIFRGSSATLRKLVGIKGKVAAV